MQNLNKAHHQGSATSPFWDPNVAEELGNLVQGQSGTGAWVWDLPTNTVHWTQEVYRIFDAPDFDNTLESFQKMVLPEDRDAGLEVVSRALSARQPFQTHFRAKTPKGEVRQLSNVGRALYDDAGKPKLLVGLVALVTPPAATPVCEAECSVAGAVPSYDAAIRSIRELRDHFLLVRANPYSPTSAQTDVKVLSFLLERVLEPNAALALATRLLREFNSMADVLGADRVRLKAIEGIREEHMLLFDIAQYSMESVLHPRAEPLRFDNTDTLIRYLRASHAYQAKEQLRVMFLDRAHHILANEVMQEGTVDHTPVYMREIIKRALELSASFLVLVHNHPSGDPSPSYVDIEMTKEIAKVAASMNIIVNDHVILGRYGHTSLASLGII